MALKQQICEAFCEGVEVSAFSGGLGISTPYVNHVGDRIGMYALGPDAGAYRLIDNALTVALLDAEGAGIDTPTRLAAFQGLLAEYGAEFDEEMGELSIGGLSEDRMPRAVLDFSALLLRLNDLLLMTIDRVESTFKDDVRAALRSELSGRARIVEDEPVSEALGDVVPDMVFFAEGRDPVALFIANTEPKLWQAIHLRMLADYEAHASVSIVAILEADTVANSRVRTQADNRLDAVPRYRNDQRQAIQRVVTEVVGRGVLVH